MDTNSNSLTAKQPVNNLTVSSSSPTKVPPFLFWMVGLELVSLG